MTHESKNKNNALFVFKNYNILILYDYRYYVYFTYYDFKILFNLLIP